MKHTIITFFTVSFLIITNPLQAADRWSLELRGATASSTQELGDRELKAGVGAEAKIA